MGTTTRIAGATKTLVDMSTGECWTIQEDGKGKRRYVFPGGFAFVGLVYISKLRNVRLPADGYRLALLVMEKSGYGGVCSVAQAELATHLGVHRSRVSRLVSSLESAGIVARLGGARSKAIMVNPLFCFRGSAKEQQQALQAWAELHPLAIIASDVSYAETA